MFLLILLSQIKSDEENNSTNTTTPSPTEKLDLKGLTEKAKTIIASITSICGAGVISTVFYILWRCCDCFSRCFRSCCCCCCASGDRGNSGGAERTFSV